MRVHATRLAAVGALTAALTCIATAATAVPPPDGTSQVLVAVGSALPEDVMDVLAALYNANDLYNPDHDRVFNIHAHQDPPIFVPGQGGCPDRTYGAGVDPVPADSGEGLATYTNWSQVGGADAPIHRYLPQLGSETRGLFVGTVLGGVEPSTACGAVNVIQENRGTEVPAADRADAILPYLVPQWITQANQPNGMPDERGGAVIGAQRVAPTTTENPVTGPDDAGSYSPNADVIAENTDYVGVFAVYNVTDSRLPDYGQTLRFTGTDDTGDGYLCDGNAEVTGTLTAYGFQPLDADPFTGSHCRVS